MSRWGELIPHDEDAAGEGRCLCGCQDEEETAPPCQSPTCGMDLSVCICGSPFGGEVSS